ISGTCGRLMCCLKYEQEAYTDLLKKTPKIGALVSTPDGKGSVVDVNLITGILSVSLNKSPDAAPHTYKVADVTIIKDGQIKVDKSEIEKLKKLEKI
ncbi:MAG: stage 0 sporulation protein, partial [Clostridia bacterium]|nr:stage 0 sporulation protein [Clostridia bacterium]